ncbi:MAG: DUF4258 domain-containing protein [Nanoarchaeota archaeon]
MIIEISDHAMQAMAQDGLSEELVRRCVEHGELKFKNAVDGEMRYAHSLVLEECSLIVIYTVRGDVHRVVTAYLVRGKKRWLVAR